MRCPLASSLSVFDEFSRFAGKLVSVRAQARTHLERVAGIEPASSAWKAEVLPLNYTRRLIVPLLFVLTLVEGEGFEPSKAKPSDLQSDPFDHSGTPPENANYTVHHDPLWPHRHDEKLFKKQWLNALPFSTQHRYPAAAPWCRHKESNPGPSHYK